MPPMHWLRAIFGLTTHPTSYAPMMRGTRTMPRSGSMRTSTKTAPNAYDEKRSLSSPGSASAVASMWPSPRRRNASAYAAPSAPSSPRTVSQAARTAQPTLAIVIEPPWTGAFGMSVSPSSKRTRCSGRSSASAATCVIAV